MLKPFCYIIFFHIPFLNNLVSAQDTIYTFDNTYYDGQVICGRTPKLTFLAYPWDQTIGTRYRLYRQWASEAQFGFRYNKSENNDYYGINTALAILYRIWNFENSHMFTGIRGRVTYSKNQGWNAQPIYSCSFAAEVPFGIEIKPLARVPNIGFTGEAFLNLSNIGENDFYTRIAFTRIGITYHIY